MHVSTLITLAQLTLLLFALAVLNTFGLQTFLLYSWMLVFEYGAAKGFNVFKRKLSDTQVLCCYLLFVPSWMPYLPHQWTRPVIASHKLYANRPHPRVSALTRCNCPPFPLFN